MAQRLALLALVAAAGCGDGLPEIRNLKYSPNAALVGVMTTITATVDYTDTDNDISQGVTKLIDPNGNVSTSTPDPIMNAGMGIVGKVTFTIPFTPTVAGFWGLQLYIIDLPGYKSNVLQGILRVSPNAPAP